jgi:hypothetical protein
MSEAQALEVLRECSAKSQSSDWRVRMEAIEQLQELFRQIDLKAARNLKSVETADMFGKLISDQNAKIQIMVLESLNAHFKVAVCFVEHSLKAISRPLVANLASSNTAVRKLSDSLLKKCNSSASDKVALV